MLSAYPLLLINSKTEGGNLGVCSGLGCGEIFQLTPHAGGGWTESVPVTFNGSNGVFPISNLIPDGDGHFWGITEYGGGSGNYGTVFEFTP
jgi:uncharacterized repeat protein (TIGR03803 family)